MSVIKCSLLRILCKLKYILVHLPHLLGTYSTYERSQGTKYRFPTQTINLLSLFTNKVFSLEQTLNSRTRRNSISPLTTFLGTSKHDIIWKVILLITTRWNLPEPLCLYSEGPRPGIFLRDRPLFDYDLKVLEFHEKYISFQMFLLLLWGLYLLKDNCSVDLTLNTKCSGWNKNNRLRL